MKKITILLVLMILLQTIFVSCGQEKLKAEITESSIDKIEEIEGNPNVINVQIGVVFEKSKDGLIVIDNYKDYEEVIKSSSVNEMPIEEINKIESITAKFFDKNTIIYYKNYYGKKDNVMKGVNYAINKNTLTLSLVQSYIDESYTNLYGKGVMYIIPKEEFKKVKKVNINVETIKNNE